MTEHTKSKRLPAVLLAAVLLAATICCFGKPHSSERLEEPYTIFIATDMHYLSPQLSGDDHFFGAPSANFDGKVIHYSDEVTRAFLAEAEEKQPDLVILSGDLTLNGAAQSHREMAAYLQQLQQSGVQVLVLAGNHDIGGSGGDYSGEEVALVEGTSPGLFRELYSPFGWDQAISRDEYSMSYIYQATDKLRILMLDTNVAGKGYVLAGTLRWLEQELAYAHKHGIKVIGVSHQNLYAHNELLSFGYQMYNADMVTPIYEKYGVRANFSGHIHVQSILRDKPVPEVVTASMAVMPAAYGVLQYSGRDFTYTTAATDVAAWAAAEGIADEQLLGYGEYCRWYFEECSREKTRRQFAESGLAAAEIELMADAFAGINSAYFSGEGADGEAYAEGLALWQQHGQGGFTLAYFDTMLAAAEKDMLTLRFG